MVETVLSNYMSLHCHLGREESKPTLVNDIPAYDVAWPYQGGKKKFSGSEDIAPDKHSLTI